MKSPPAIVDTNVVVAGLVTVGSEVPTAVIVDGMLEAAFPFVVSDALLSEYTTVLHRRGVRQLHKLTDEELDAVLVALAQHAIVLSPAPGPHAPDKGDQHLWDLLEHRPDLILITGDKALLETTHYRGRIITPRRFIEMP